VAASAIDRATVALGLMVAAPALAAPAAPAAKLIATGNDLLAQAGALAG
jgi:hypothetical protein